MTTLHEAILDGKRIEYDSETVFCIQVSKGKGAYHDRYRVVGNLAQAVVLYNGINLGPGYKARLMSDFMVPSVLARKKGL